MISNGLCNTEKTDKYFIEEAKLVAKRSPDNMKVGACLVSKCGAIISKGHNSLPSHINKESTGGRLKSEERNKWIIHAEASAIGDAARLGISTNYTTLYCTHTVCPNCMSLLINSGVDTIVMSEENHLLMMTSEKHTKNWEITRQMMEEALIYWRFV